MMVKMFFIILLLQDRFITQIHGSPYSLQSKSRTENGQNVQKSLVFQSTSLRLWMRHSKTVKDNSILFQDLNFWLHSTLVDTFKYFFHNIYSPYLLAFQRLNPK